MAEQQVNVIDVSPAALKVGAKALRSGSAQLSVLAALGSGKPASIEGRFNLAPPGHLWLYGAGDLDENFILASIVRQAAASGFIPVLLCCADCAILPELSDQKCPTSFFAKILIFCSRIHCPPLSKAEPV